MNRAVRGALIGAAVGGLVAVAQSVRQEDDPAEVVTIQALKGAAQGAAAGALVGWLLDLRVSDTAREAWERVRTSDAADAARGAWELTRERAVEVAGAARRRAA